MSHLGYRGGWPEMTEVIGWGRVGQGGSGLDTVRSENVLVSGQSSKRTVFFFCTEYDAYTPIFISVSAGFLSCWQRKQWKQR